MKMITEVPGSRKTMHQVNKAGRKTGVTVHQAIFEGVLTKEEMEEVLRMNAWPKNAFGFDNKTPRFFIVEEGWRRFTVFSQETRM